MPFTIPPKSFLENFKLGMYDLAIIDLLMPRMNGFDLYERLKKVDPNLTVCSMPAFESMDRDKALLEKYMAVVRQQQRQQQQQCGQWTFIRKLGEMDKVVQMVMKQLERSVSHKVSWTSRYGRRLTTFLECIGLLGCQMAR